MDIMFANAPSKTISATGLTTLPGKGTNMIVSNLQTTVAYFTVGSSSVTDTSVNGFCPPNSTQSYMLRGNETHINVSSGGTVSLVVQVGTGV